MEQAWRRTGPGGDRKHPSWLAGLANTLAYRIGLPLNKLNALLAGRAPGTWVPRVRIRSLARTPQPALRP